MSSSGGPRSSDDPGSVVEAGAGRMCEYCGEQPGISMVAIGDPESGEEIELGPWVCVQCMAGAAAAMPRQAPPNRRRADDKRTERKRQRAARRRNRR
jgi:hypothetical protein